MLPRAFEVSNGVTGLERVKSLIGLHYVEGEEMNMRTPISFTHPRDEILETIERIYRNRMTTAPGGKLSIREENGDIWITPTRVDKGSLRRGDIVRV
jgi:hypothetical protein